MATKKNLDYHKIILSFKQQQKLFFFRLKKIFWIENDLLLQVLQKKTLYNNKESKFLEFYYSRWFYNFFWSGEETLQFILKKKKMPVISYWFIEMEFCTRLYLIYFNYLIIWKVIKIKFYVKYNYIFLNIQIMFSHTFYTRF